MQNQYKSPLKVLSKSTSKPSRSVTKGKRSKYKQQSESKSHAALVKEISDRQPYKNLLNRLLRSENLTKFIREAEKYVELTEDIIAPYKTKNIQNERSRKEFQEYGRALLKDGSFIRYYCKLVEKDFHQQRKKVREMFFEKYRHEVCLREKMFNDYFKEEVPNEDSQTFSFSKSKSKCAHRDGGHSKSKKKAKTEINFCVKEKDKVIDNLTAIDHVDSSNSIGSKDSKQSKQSKQSQNQVRSECKKGKIVHFQQQEQETYEEEFYRSPYLKYRSKESEEEREQRLSGISKSNLKSNEKRKSIIVKFSDEIKSNQKLKEIYQQLVREKEERDKQLKSSQKTTTNSSSKPIIRTSTTSLPLNFSEIKLRELTSQDRAKLTQIQKEILNFYPSIHLRAFSKGVQVSAMRIEGYYKNYIIKKAVITDINHYCEPDYIGIIAHHINNEKKDEIKPCPFEPDDRIEVILFE